MKIVIERGRWTIWEKSAFNIVAVRIWSYKLYRQTNWFPTSRFLATWETPQAQQKNVSKMSEHPPPSTHPLTMSHRIRNPMKLCNALVCDLFSRSQQNFAHVTTVTLSWNVQNFVVISWYRFKPEHCKFLLAFWNRSNYYQWYGHLVLQ